MNCQSTRTFSLVKYSFAATRSGAIVRSSRPAARTKVVDAPKYLDFPNHWVIAYTEAIANNHTRAPARKGLHPQSFDFHFIETSLLFFEYNVPVQRRGPQRTVRCNRLPRSCCTGRQSAELPEAVIIDSLEMDFECAVAGNHHRLDGELAGNIPAGCGSLERRLMWFFLSEEISCQSIFWPLQAILSAHFPCWSQPC